MPHRGLSCPGSDAAGREQRAERVPQGVNVEGASPVVSLVDPRDGEVAVEGPDQLPGHVEQRRRQRKPRGCAVRHRQAARHRQHGRVGRREGGPLVREPRSQVGGKVGPERQLGGLAVLRVGGVEDEPRRVGVEQGVADGQARQFVTPQPGEHQRLVDERSAAAASL
ncbi:MAG: hypothetical protein AAF805_01105 [Planctomycetota bacterium]